MIYWAYRGYITSTYFACKPYITYIMITITLI